MTRPRSPSLLLRCVLLTIAFALTSYALARWQTIAFSFVDIWPMADELELHPVHVLVLGIAMIPPALWEIFLLDTAGPRE